VSPKRNRLEVRFASRTLALGGNARYRATRSATVASCCRAGVKVMNARYLSDGALPIMNCTSVRHTGEYRRSGAHPGRTYPPYLATRLRTADRCTHWARTHEPWSNLGP
jgi:hypothetical protein